MSEIGGGVRVAANTQDVLGEVPVWDADKELLWWTDVFRPAIHRLDAASGEVESWTPPDKVHSFALRENGGMVIAGRKGFAFYDPEAGTYELLHDPREDSEGTLLNDGRADRQGRFWAGTMDKLLKRPSGQLFRLDADRTSHMAADGITLPNGVAFSPDGGTLYYADSLLKNIFAFDLDGETGVLSNKRIFAETDALPGIPDGATVDAEGFLWSARFDGGRAAPHAGRQRRRRDRIAGLARHLLRPRRPRPQDAFYHHRLLPPDRRTTRRRTPGRCAVCYRGRCARRTGAAISRVTWVELPLGPIVDVVHNVRPAAEGKYPEPDHIHDWNEE